jgi:hypothetical protein
MHRASLRKSVSNPARPEPQRGTLAPQALFLFCQSGKSEQVNNKALVLSHGNGHLISEASCVLSENCDQLRSKLDKSVLSIKQSAKIIRLLNFVKFTRHSPQAGEPKPLATLREAAEASTSRALPAQRSGSPRP